MKKRTITLIIIVAAMAAGLGLWFLQGSQGGHANKAVSVTVGADPTAVNSLICIAQDQGYFTAQGLDVTIKEYASAKAAASVATIPREPGKTGTPAAAISRRA